MSGVDGLVAVAEHPRDGYIVALFHGLAESGASVLVEVHETYNAWGQPESKRHHYNALDLGRPATKWETLTIGGIGFDPDSDDPPPFIARNVRPQTGAFAWRRLR